jgi:hypothetical protein
VKQVLSKEIDAVQENENGKDEEVEGGILLVVEAESCQLRSQRLHILDCIGRATQHHSKDTEESLQRL